MLAMQAEVAEEDQPPQESMGNEVKELQKDNAHGGRFTGHFGDLLRQYYWWSGMHADVHRHCHAYLVCGSQKGTDRTSRPPLQPILVGGPF